MAGWVSSAPPLTCVYTPCDHVHLPAGVIATDRSSIPRWTFGAPQADVFGISGMQAGQVALPSISQEAQGVLDRMGLSFSCSTELFLRLLRHWKQLLLYHHQSRPDAAGAGGDLPQEVLTQVGLCSCSMGMSMCRHFAYNFQYKRYSPNLVRAVSNILF